MLFFLRSFAKQAKLGEGGVDAQTGQSRDCSASRGQPAARANVTRPPGVCRERAKAALPQQPAARGAPDAPPACALRGRRPLAGGGMEKGPRGVGIGGGAPTTFWIPEQES